MWHSENQVSERDTSKSLGMLLLVRREMPSKCSNTKFYDIHTDTVVALSDCNGLMQWAESQGGPKLGHLAADLAMFENAVEVVSGDEKIAFYR